MNAIDLFSGAGGLCIALQQCGFNILFANEINHKFTKTHIYNFPEIPLIEKDITNVFSTDYSLYIRNKTIDLVTGGPPCQGFSIFGKRRFINTKNYNPYDDTRNFLVYQYIRIIQELRPKFFFMENVKGFTNLDKGLFVDDIKRRFNSLGYKNIWTEVICAADYGVPQERYRMFMIGNRLNIDFEKPEPTHFSIKSNMFPKYNTVGQTIMDLVGKEDKIPNHIALKHKPIVEARYSYIKEGCRLNIEDLPADLSVTTRKDSKTGKVSNYSHVFKRLHRNKPATTMVPGHNAFPVHPTLNRTLTAREAARIQTFPDSHVFFGTRQDQCIQVGNAVPPQMAQPFLEKIKWYIQNFEKGNQL